MEDDTKVAAYEHTIATESDNDTLGEDQLLDVDMSLDDTIYPSPDSTVCSPLHLPHNDTDLDLSYRRPIS